MKFHFKPISNLFIFVILSLSCLSVTTAQEYDYKKNAIYASYGSVIFSSQISIAYDRTVYEKNQFRTKIKINYGNYADKYPDLSSDEREYRSYYGLSGVIVFGLFEASIGVGSAKYTLAQGDMPSPGVDYDEVMNGIIFQGSSGIRYEANDFILRAGIGNLELLYIGVGFVF